MWTAWCESTVDGSAMRQSRGRGSPGGLRFTGVSLFKLHDDGPQPIVEPVHRLFADRRRKTVRRMSNPARDTRERVGVASE